MEKLGFSPDLEFGTKNELREKCSRFLRFSYLLDFLALESLSNIYVQSTTEFIDKLNKLSYVEIEMSF